MVCLSASETLSLLCLFSGARHVSKMATVTTFFVCDVKNKLLAWDHTCLASVQITCELSYHQLLSN